MFRYVIQGLTSNELGDNHYKLFPDDAATNLTLFGDIGNATDLFFFPSGTDLSPGSNADQAGKLLNLFIQSSPVGGADWNNSFLGALEDFIDCGMLNECFVDPIAVSFMGCYLLNLPRKAPCGQEWHALTDAIADSGERISHCLGVGEDNNNTIESANEFSDLESRDQDRLVLCLLDSVLPSGFLKDMTKFVADTIEKLTGVGRKQLIIYWQEKQGNLAN